MRGTLATIGRSSKIGHITVSDPMAKARTENECTANCGYAQSDVRADWWLPCIMAEQLGIRMSSLAPYPPI
jgi:hypothetical protein